MLNISGFLEKFKKFDQNKTLQTENIIRSIESVVGIKVDKSSITIKNGIFKELGCLLTD